MAFEPTMLTSPTIAEVYERYGRMVYNVCLRVLNNQSDAEDATQAVFLLYMKKASTLDPQTKLGGWLQRAAVLVAGEGRRAEYRRQRREQENSNMNLSGQADADSEEKLWSELRPNLDGAIAALPEKFRLPVVLVYLSGQSQKDAARALKLNDSTLRWRLSEAIERLRKMFAENKQLSVALLLLLLEARGQQAVPSEWLSSAICNPGSQAAKEPNARTESVERYFGAASKAIFRRNVKIGAVTLAILAALTAIPISYALLVQTDSRTADFAQRVEKKTAEARSAAPQVSNGAVGDNEKFEGLPIREITVHGNAAIPATKILSMIQSKTGEACSRSKLENDRKKLSESGKFSLVEWNTPVTRDGGVELSLTVLEKNAGADFDSGPPQMIPNQTAMPDGGRVALYSRNRHGNYPLATYALHLGLRGDDVRVCNDVNLLFGNIARKKQYAGLWIDEVPGSVGLNGAAGMSDGLKNSEMKLIDETDDPSLKDEKSTDIQERLHDTFQVVCHGGQANKIVDLGAIDYEIANPAAKDFAHAPTRIIVQANHVYAIRLRTDAEPKSALYFKLKVLQHRDNDAVIFDWEPLQQNHPEKDTDF